MTNPNLYYDLIKRPILTEKSSQQQELLNQYTFEVARKANRNEIRKAVETLFGVTVTKVNVMNVPGKYRRILGRPGQTSNWKKAIVTLKAGDAIEIA